MELGNELLHKEAEGVRVRVDLAHSHVDAAKVADASEDLQEWVDGPLPHGVGLAPLAPLHITQVSNIKEGLIYVYDRVAIS